MEELKLQKADRAVIAATANNESLPFKDETFDCYIASLSLMLVENHLNMLKEAYRVCKPGTSLGFTIWGRKENNQNFEILDVVFEKHGLKPKTAPSKTPYDLGKNQEGLKQDFISLGFKNVRIWYQHNNFSFRDGQEYLESMQNQTSFKNAMALITSPD